MNSVVFRGVLLIAICACVVTPAGAATRASVPPNGTYRYDILVGGSVIAKSTVVVESLGSRLSVRERLHQGSVRVADSAKYAMPSLSLASYSADVNAPGGSQHTAVTGKTGSIVVDVPGEHVTITADAAAPLLIVSDNFVGTQIMLPAILHATGAKTFTMAVLAGGKAIVAHVMGSSEELRPGNVPISDAQLAIEVAGLREVFWYDAKTFVVDDIQIPAQNAEVRLIGRGSVVPLASPTPIPTPLPLPPARYTSRDVTFVSADGTKLAGTLTIPDGPARALSAVVLVQGSGPMDRNERVGPNPVFAQLGNAFSNAGFVVLRYDKRGVGASGGTPGATRPMLLADAAAAYEFLRVQSSVDRKRVFMLGHSEGGELVPTVAATQRSIAGIILMAPPALPLWQVSMKQVLESVPISEQALARRQELQALNAVRNGTKRGPGMAWYRSSMDVDPLVDIKRVSCPILILQGADDIQVLAGDLPRLEAAAKSSNHDVTVRVFANDNHLFMPVSPHEPLTSTAELQQYLTVPGYIDAKVLSALIDWLKQKSAFH